MPSPGGWCQNLVGLEDALQNGWLASRGEKLLHLLTSQGCCLWCENGGQTALLEHPVPWWFQSGLSNVVASSFSLLVHLTFQCSVKCEHLHCSPDLFWRPIVPSLPMSSPLPGATRTANTLSPLLHSGSTSSVFSTAGADLYRLFQPCLATSTQEPHPLLFTPRTVCSFICGFLNPCYADDLHLSISILNGL